MEEIILCERLTLMVRALTSINVTEKAVLHGAP